MLLNDEEVDAAVDRKRKKYREYEEWNEIDEDFERRNSQPPTDFNPERKRLELSCKLSVD